MDAVKAGCLCGKVRLVAQGKPYRAGLCHCMGCRKHHRAVFLPGGSSVFSRSEDEIHLDHSMHPINSYQHTNFGRPAEKPGYRPCRT